MTSYRCRIHKNAVLTSATCPVCADNDRRSNGTEYVYPFIDHYSMPPIDPTPAPAATPDPGPSFESGGGSFGGGGASGDYGSGSDSGSSGGGGDSGGGGGSD